MGSIEGRTAKCVVDGAVITKIDSEGLRKYREETKKEKIKGE